MKNIGKPLEKCKKNKGKQKENNAKTIRKPPEKHRTNTGNT